LALISYKSPLRNRFIKTSGSHCRWFVVQLSPLLHASIDRHRCL
jgi:hypothetical protein